MNQTDPTTTIHEACARAIEWMARGHVAHEHLFLDEVVRRIRAVSRPAKAYDVYEDVQVALLNWQCEPPIAENAEKTRLINRALDRIKEEVGERLDNPMAVYDDGWKWWPNAPTESAA